MGIAEILSGERLLNIYAKCIFYGDAASAALSKAVANDIQIHWNEPRATVWVNNAPLQVVFRIDGFCDRTLQPESIFSNDNPAYNYFRIEKFSHSDISFVDAIGGNTGYFKLDNLLNHSTTAAHEFGHTLGLSHPANMDIRGRGIPGIMYPRGTITDPQFQYDPVAMPATKGGTLNPIHRRVLQTDIDDLQLSSLKFNTDEFAVIGNFSSVWHDKHANPGYHL